MPRHFHRMNNPKAAKQNDIDLTNTFVSFTHVIGLSRFFTYVPPLFDRHSWREDHDIDPSIVEEIWGGDKKDYEPHHKNLYK